MSTDIWHRRQNLDNEDRKGFKQDGFELQLKDVVWGNILAADGGKREVGSQKGLQIVKKRS